MKQQFSIFKLQRILDTYVGGLLIFLFRPISLALEPVLKRDHDLAIRQSFVVVKILGGGSLFVAAPSLIALRKKYPEASFEVVCSDKVAPFAELLGIFDVIHTIRTDTAPGFVLSSFSTLFRIFRCDTILDLEIYSKLTSIFCLFTCARNRVGFFMNLNSWQSGLTTHSLFLNDSAPTYEFYAQAATLLGAEAISTVDARSYFREKNNWPANQRSRRAAKKVALAPFSSALAPEREFSVEEWVTALQIYNLLVDAKEVIILGAPSEKEKGEELADAIRRAFSEIAVENLCGSRSLRESTEELFSVSSLVTIDSGMNHVARLLGVPIHSFYGPTNPQRLTQPMPELEETVRYQPTYCSPCVHLIDTPPCRGNNICMKRLIEPQLDPDLRKHGWLVTGRRT